MGTGLDTKAFTNNGNWIRVLVSFLLHLSCWVSTLPPARPTTSQVYWFFFWTDSLWKYNIFWPGEDNVCLISHYSYICVALWSSQEFPHTLFCSLLEVPDRYLVLNWVSPGPPWSISSGRAVCTAGNAFDSYITLIRSRIKWNSWNEATGRASF